MTPKHFLSLADIPATALRSILDEAKSLKRARRGFPKGRQDLDAPFAGETLAMLFEKSSTRTRFSFDMGMRQLGGSSITASSSDLQIGRGETIADTSRVLSRFVDAIMIRANEHSTVVEMAEHATIPVINGLTNYNHPCQIMADLQTLEEHRGDLSDMTLTWVGDGNNVAVSFVNAAAAFGYRLRLACPAGYEVDAQSVARARAAGAQIEALSDAAQAAMNTDVIIADTWVSMGDLDADQRFKDLAAFQVTDALMERAAPNAVFLHCLPAHRGEEVVASVIDGPQSIVFDEAENRLHAQKAILRWCMDA